MKANRRNVITVLVVVIMTVLFSGCGPDSDAISARSSRPYRAGHVTSYDEKTGTTCYFENGVFIECVND